MKTLNFTLSIIVICCPALFSASENCKPQTSTKSNQGQDPTKAVKKEMIAPVKTSSATKEAPKLIACTAVDFNGDLMTILGQLEKTCNTLNSFKGDMAIETIALTRDEVTQEKGNLWYKSAKSGIKARIHLSQTRNYDTDEAIDERAKFSQYDEDYSFDGKWIVNRNGTNRSLKKYEVEQTKDPKAYFKLGKGPFPMPFTLTKKDLLAQFAIQLMPIIKTPTFKVSTAKTPPQKQPISPIAKERQLKLIPLVKGDYYKEYKEINLWLRNKDYLPIKISTQDKQAVLKTVTWTNIQINQKIDDKAFELKAHDDSWTVEVTPLGKKQ